MREALRSEGKNAISVDFRDTEVDGPHVVGDVREVVSLQRWKSIYFVGPNCYQHLRADVDCLPAKIRDGRAFWAGAMVMWCICCPRSDSVLVEQPDTIFDDYFHVEDVGGVEFAYDGLW